MIDKFIVTANNFVISPKLLNSLYDQFYMYFFLLTKRNYIYLLLGIFKQRISTIIKLVYFKKIYFVKTQGQ